MAGRPEADIVDIPSSHHIIFRGGTHARGRPPVSCMHVPRAAIGEISQLLPSHRRQLATSPLVHPIAGLPFPCHPVAHRTSHHSHSCLWRRFASAGYAPALSPVWCLVACARACVVAGTNPRASAPGCACACANARTNVCCCWRACDRHRGRDGAAEAHSLLTLSRSSTGATTATNGLGEESVCMGVCMRLRWCWHLHLHLHLHGHGHGRHQRVRMHRWHCLRVH